MIFIFFYKEKKVLIPSLNNPDNNDASFLISSIENENEYFYNIKLIKIKSHLFGWIKIGK